MERTTISAIPWCIPKHPLCHRCPPLLTRGLFGECSPCRWSTIHFSRPWVRPRTVPEQTQLRWRSAPRVQWDMGFLPTCGCGVMGGCPACKAQLQGILQGTKRGRAMASQIGRPATISSILPWCATCVTRKRHYLLTGTATSQRSHFPPSQIFHAKRNDFRSGMARSSWWTSKKLPDCIFWNLDEDEDFVDFLDIVDVPRANWWLSQRILVESWWKGSISCSTSFSSGSVSTTATSFGLCTPLLSMLQINSPSVNDASRESWWTMMLICCTIPAWSFPSRSSLQWPIISGATATGSTSALGQQIMAIESLGNSNHQHSANGSIQSIFWISHLALSHHSFESFECIRLSDCSVQLIAWCRLSPSLEQAKHCHCLLLELWCILQTLLLPIPKIAPSSLHVLLLASSLPGDMPKAVIMHAVGQNPAKLVDMVNNLSLLIIPTE